MGFTKRIAKVITNHPDVLDNPDRTVMIQEAVDNREAILSANGALTTWTPPESTGRSPKDTYIVHRAESEGSIDWDSPNNISLEPETFDMLMEDALQVLECPAVELQLKDGNTQTVLVPVDDDPRLEEYIYVLMPMRL